MPDPFINDLLPFGTGPGANVLPQVSYQGLPARLTGFVSGVAESAHLNKAWRQSAFTSAMIGQFTMHNALADVLDDGDVDAYEEKFKTAIRASASLRRAPLGGTATAATVVFTPPFMDYAGIFFMVDVTTTLEDDATLKVDSLGVMNLLRDDGTRIQKGDMPAGAAMLVAHDGSGLRVLNMTPYTIQSGSTNYAAQSRVAGTANSPIITMNPPVLYYREGAVYRFVPALTNDGPVNVSLNGLPAKPLVEMDGTPIAPGTLVPGIPMWMQDAGATFLFLRFSTYLSDWSRTLPGLFWASAGPTGFTTLTSTAWTKVSCPIENIDVEGWYDPGLSRYTPQYPGYYFISGDSVFGSSGELTPTASHGVRVFKNGAPTFTSGVGDAPGSLYAGHSNGARGLLSGITYLNGSTDFIQYYAYQDFVDTNSQRRATATRFGGWFIGV